DAAPNTPTQKVGDLYRSVLDAEGRKAAGTQPIQSLLDSIDSAASKKALAASMGSLLRSGIYGPFASYVSIDAKKSDEYAVYLTQTGLTLPDRDYYLKDDERYVELREKLLAYVGEMLEISGGDSDDAQVVLDLEMAIADAQWTNVENRDPDKTYNATTPEQLAATLDGFDWDGYSQACGMDGQPKYVVRQPDYLEFAGRWFQENSLDDLKSYMRFRIIDAYADSLSPDLEKKHFDFHQTAVNGISEQEEPWKRGVNITGSVLGEVVGKLYVDKYFAPEAKQKMVSLVDNLKVAFNGRINQLEWMGEGTKKQAVEKLGKFTTKIGYPDEWKDYSKLVIADVPLATNLIAASQFEHERELNKLGGPIDRNEWHMTPQTINAYYNPTMNEIVFPAAILQPPFFNLNADDAVNYGGIGAVIGHEISHGFDDKGSKYDGDGNLRNWWTTTDRSEFEGRAGNLVEQYNQYAPFDDMNVNGELTLGENIGDLGGLSVAYQAYRLSLGEKEAPIIDGMTGDQRFFLGWSQVWRRLYREAALRKRLLTDPHSPSEYRVNGIVRNMDAWYDAFGISEDDDLFLEPKDRVRIW
ncbi:MAG: M13-type metalloendopeptidase, partial [Planctomycetota bacterium]